MNRTDLVNPYEGDANLAARLFMHMHAFLYEETGQLLPKEIDLADTWNVLDAGCGLGGWALDMARVHQDMDIVGLDIDPQVLVLARMDGRAWLLDNVNFVEGSLFHMTEMEDNSFDLLHVRFINPVVPRQSWPHILQELMRVCRPGGKIVWTETTAFESNSKACMRWCELVRRAVMHPEASTQTPLITDMLLSDASWRRVQRFESSVDLSTGSRAHTRVYRNLTYLLSMTQLYLVEMGVAPTSEIEQVGQDMILDLYSDTFHATWSLMTVVGEKPV